MHRDLKHPIVTSKRVTNFYEKNGLNSQIAQIKLIIDDLLGFVDLSILS